MFEQIQIFFTANRFKCTMRENAQMCCELRFRIAKRLQLDYLLPLFQPAWFQHLQAHHQQIQGLLTSIQGWDTREYVLFGKNPCLKIVSTQNVLPLCSLPSTSSRIDAQS
jgi:hypothetical protein